MRSDDILANDTRYAKATFRKDRRLNIRLSSKDLEAIQKRALAEGLPYQTLIWSLLHKVRFGLPGDLVPFAEDGRTVFLTDYPDGTRVLGVEREDGASIALCAHNPHSKLAISIALEETKDSRPSRSNGDPVNGIPGYGWWRDIDVLHAARLRFDPGDLT